MLGEGACCNMLRSMKRLQSPFKRTVVLDGHKTSINVEPEFWDQLRLITLERQTTMAKLITEIDRIGRLLPPQGPGCHRVRTLSAAIRVFVLQEVLARVDDLTVHASEHPAAARHSCPTDLDQIR
jgi:predicted DNA-binding ribbon-helix-helix protein